MRTLIFSALALAAATGLTTTAQAETSVDRSCYTGLAYDYVAGNIGIVLSEGVHLQGGCTFSYNGFLVEGWASSDGYLVDGEFEADSNDGFDYEVDLMVGWAGEVAEDVTVRVDYAWFQVGTGTSDEVVENARLFVNWNRDGIQPYLRAQNFSQNGFGPGKGTAVVVGAKYNQFAAEVGGHDGLFGQDATLTSFARAKWGSEPIKNLGGATIGLQLQAGLEKPVDDRVILNINWGF